MKKDRRIIAVLLAFAIILGGIPVGFLGADAVVQQIHAIDRVKFDLTDDEYTEQSVMDLESGVPLL